MVAVELVISYLSTGLQAIQALTDKITPEQARWKPDPQQWSILEVINHLYDEERADFRFRIRQTIEQPNQLLPPIDPDGWVIERRYNERDLEASLAGFVQERRESICWLSELHFGEWNRPLQHPHLTTLCVGDVLAAWAGHDLLHIRQLNELHWQYLGSQVTPYTLHYAGDW
jgi:hypothetical protein